MGPHIPHSVTVCNGQVAHTCRWDQVHFELSIASVHLHDISAGSGSYDGVAGLTLNTRWQRWFFNSQFQYYIRTGGESGFRYGDELMVSGGRGGYVLLSKKCTLSLQANAV